MRSGEIYLAGMWERGGEQAPLRHPFTGEQVATVGQATFSQMDDAIAGAVEAFEETRRLSSRERVSILEAIATNIKERDEEIAQTITRETGKVIRDARGEVARAVGTFHITAHETRHLDELHPLVFEDGTKKGSWRYVPLGPIAAISPFNFPINLIAHKVAPAIGAGNTVIVKPPPQGPGAALILAEIIDATMLPKGALSLVPSTNEVAERLVTDERIRMLSFTGSAAVGWRLKALAGQKKVLLELGGNAAAIVCKDANLDCAVDRIAFGAFANAGQICLSTQRVFVERQVFQDFVEKLCARAKRFQVGDPTDEKTDIGPLIDEKATQRVEEWLGEAIGRGAHVLLGGKKSGRLFPPTIVVDSPCDAKIMCEEVFAPVVIVTPFDHFDGALSMVNASLFGLVAAVWTKDQEKIRQAAEEIDAGQVIMNEATVLRHDAMPYGGMKASGLGREGPSFALREMSEVKVVIEATPH